MKKLTFLFATILLINVSCTKKDASEQLYGTTWELEYISGPRIAFDGLFPNKKPQLTFDKETMKVMGNDGCNGYSAEFTLGKENAISFGEAGPTTMMYCGQGEQEFLKTIKKINKYSFDEERKLNLLLDDVSMMRFKKVTLTE
ncbi:META domain-containing protein [Tenacibaculum caenipelagi]|uniref:Heat shock protein HslJ n=1 Tax=Tenacibaculum caenipelagi TaxID=1325435 RepID=A0A4R6TC12_9FLAO|nr:META domain-containing protein [Tenacibaculum caenipelagi]TDQ24009.1 heat shock protein HslJ [Tenacibaculum caenipelagi]